MPFHTLVVNAVRRVAAHVQGHRAGGRKLIAGVHRPERVGGGEFERRRGGRTIDRHIEMAGPNRAERRSPHRRTRRP